jgi:N-acetylgalactosamine kinase
MLAAGKGSRMGRADTAKVCFEIDGVPAITRSIDTFKQCGFQKFVLVVGARAQNVLETVGRDHPDVIYVHQHAQQGTGHAARLAAGALQGIGFAGNVLVTMGDKLLAKEAIEALIGGFVKQQADLALLTIPKTKETAGSGGRIFCDASGQALDIVERADLNRQLIVDELQARLNGGKPVGGKDIIKIIAKYISDPGKQVLALPQLMAWCQSKGNVSKSDLKKILFLPENNIVIGGQAYSAKEIESRCGQVNPSLYLFTAKAFYEGVGLIDNENAQGEYYLTDAVKHLSASPIGNGPPSYRVRTVPVRDPNWIQGYNSPDELLRIQDYLRRRQRQKNRQGSRRDRPSLPRSQYATVTECIERVESKSPRLKRWLTRIYGQHDDLHTDKCRDLVKVLKCYGKAFGVDEKVCIVRAPGRVNLMGRHVDHRGGYNNFLATDRETLAVVGLRQDDRVIAVNVNPRQFKTVKFSVSELMGRFAWSDWLNFVNSDWVRTLLRSSAGDWGNYIKAALLRLQHHYADVQIQGLNMALAGNVPIAAGLSSSSTIVVATLQAGIALNNCELNSQQFIDLCGEGEWFVGSRGGSGDHAAITLGQRGKIACVRYLPFQVEGIIDAPKDYQVLIADSHIKAAKSGSAKDKFNEKVASYNLGLALLKQRCPELNGVVNHLRDVDPTKLACSTSDIYRMLLKVPQYMTRQTFRDQLGQESSTLLESSFATHAEPNRYNVRGVLLYGIAEIARSRMCSETIGSGHVEEFGRLMQISHDGDRVSYRRDGQIQMHEDRYTDNRLHELISDLASEDPNRVLGAQLYRQPGHYACSTPDIDQMVDIACDVPGVAGAQIAGAGLGGCVMILARKDAVKPVQAALRKHYYNPRKIKPAVLSCIMSDGAGLADF